MKKVKDQFIVFVVGGVLSAVVDLSVTVIMLNLVFRPMIAVTGGFISGLSVNLLYHSKITFQVGVSIKSSVRYCLIIILNYIITITVVYVVHDLLGGAVILGKIISLPVVAVHGFLWSRYWIFDRSKLTRNASEG